MIVEKLNQAKRTVTNWASLGKGQAGFEWQSEMLTKQGDLDAATELALWWNAHPANPDPIG